MWTRRSNAAIGWRAWAAPARGGTELFSSRSGQPGGKCSNCQRKYFHLLYNQQHVKTGLFVSSMTTPNDRYRDDEIDLLPFIHALWKSKFKIIAATVVGVAISFAVFYTTAPKWVASTYIAKPALLSLYNELRNAHIAPATEQASEIRLYSSIQDDVFNTAMGIMTANGIDSTGTPQPYIFRVSSTASSKEQAEAQLKAALAVANTQALNLNLPSLAADNTLKAFNPLSGFSTFNSKSLKPYLAPGFFIGFMFGCLVALIPLLKLHFGRATGK